MIEELQRDEAMPLPDQISSIIRTRIETGEYRPGKRLGTIRQFAKDFAVSPVTVIKALDILEEETLIERIPVKGVFVTDRLNPLRKTLNACFAFPEKEMTSVESGKENWGLNYELYRGLFAGSQKYKINLQFTYFEDKPGRKLLERQKAALRKFDFVIFPGDNQLIDLREASAAERLTCYLTNYTRAQSSSSIAVAVDYDREAAQRSLLEYFLKTGCRRAAAIADDRTPSLRAEDFLKRVVGAGIDPARTELKKIRRKDANCLEQIKTFLRGDVEFIFVHYTEYMPLIFEAAFDLGLTPGKDFIVTAIASGMTFNGLFPRFSYFRIPRYEMALQIMQSADEIIRSGGKTGTIPQLKVEFIQGKNHKKPMRSIS